MDERATLSGAGGARVLKPHRALLIAVLLCVAALMGGALLIGDSGYYFYTSLKQPWWALTPDGWAVVGAAYYMGPCAVIYRLLRLPKSTLRRRALLAMIMVLVINETWNVLLFGMQSTRAAFFAIFLVAGWLAVAARRVGRADPVGGALVAAYLLWVLAWDVRWTWVLWQRNPG